MGPMREWTVEKPGGWERLTLKERPSVPPGPGEVRVAVRAAGVNYADALVRMGVYGAVKSYPIVPGFEFSGIVTETGPGAARVKAGDSVLGVRRFGAYAEEAVVPEARLWPKPPSWSFEEAAGLPAVGLTAYHALFHLAHLEPGETVLVHSAAGGVGTAAVQLAKLHGARVAGVVGLASKAPVCRAQGADLVIDKSSSDWRREADAFSPKGFDVILDPNGYTTLRESYRRLAPSGRLLVYGFASMIPRSRGRMNWPAAALGWLRTPRFDPLDLCSSNKAVIGFNVVYLFDRGELFDRAMVRLLDWAREGRLKPLPTSAYPFEEAARAHRDLESGRTTGKLVLKVPERP